jgi:hypothetical protein
VFIVCNNAARLRTPSRDTFVRSADARGAASAHTHSDADDCRIDSHIVIRERAVCVSRSTRRSDV